MCSSRNSCSVTHLHLVREDAEGDDNFYLLPFRFTTLLVGELFQIVAAIYDAGVEEGGRF